MNVSVELTIASVERPFVQIHLAPTTAPASLVTVETAEIIAFRTASISLIYSYIGIVDIQVTKEMLTENTYFPSVDKPAFYLILEKLLTVIDYVLDHRFQTQSLHVLHVWCVLYRLLHFINAQSCFSFGVSEKGRLGLRGLKFLCLNTNPSQTSQS